MNEFKTVSLKAFTDLLSSSAPAPGGGSIAAVSAVFAVSLASMVFNLTVGKKAFNALPLEIQEKVLQYIEELPKLTDEFFSFMEQDTDAFNNVMTAFKLPAETDEEKKLRSLAIQENYIRAMEVPLEIARKAIKIYDYLQLAALYGNKNAISDVGVGVLQTASSVESAILNVRINLGAIKSTDIVEKSHKESEDIMKLSQQKKNMIMKIVYEKL